MTLYLPLSGFSPGSVVFIIILLTLMSGITAGLLWLVCASTEKRVRPWDGLPWAGQIVLCFAAIMALLLFALALSWAFRILSPVEKATLASALGFGGGNALGKGALVVALLSAPLVIWATWLKQKSYLLERDKHDFERKVELDERIAKAVLELKAMREIWREGNDGQDHKYVEPDPTARASALLALERAARESVHNYDGRHHLEIIKIICAYIRQNSPAKKLEASELPFMRKQPRIDLQTAADVLRRRSSEQVKHEHLHRYRLDLQGVDFDGVDLSGGNYTRAQMTACRFEAAFLSNTDLTGCEMDYSLLNQCDVRGAVFHATTLCFSQWTSLWSKAPFAGARLRSVEIEGANMPHLWIDRDNALAFFGSKNTTVVVDEEEQWREEALRLSHEIPAGPTLEEFLREADRREISEYVRFFLHWNPVQAGPQVSSLFRDRWRDYHGLHGWPFED